MNVLAEASANPLLPHLSEIVAGTIAFSLLFIVLRSKVVPMFEKAFAERTAAIEGGIEKAEAAQKEAQAALEQYTKSLADAKAEAAKIREDARAQGAAIIEEMRARANEEANRITAAATAAIAAERAAAVTSLRSEVGNLATELASKIVGEALEDQVRQSRVVDRFLSELEHN